MIFKTAASWLVGGKGHHAAVEEDPEAGLEQREYFVSYNVLNPLLTAGST